MEPTPHPIATEHLPFFITAPGQTDYLFYVMVVFLLAMILVVGNIYFQIHALPEQMSHRTRKVQMEIVAVLALISLFTHNHAFWIAALLLALIDLPDFSTPISSIAASLEKIAGKRNAGLDGQTAASPPPSDQPTPVEPPGEQETPAGTPPDVQPQK